MKKTIFWIGVAVLVVGIVVFSYGYTTIQNINATYIQLSYAFHMNPELKQQWDLAQMLQPLGLGLLALGAIMLLYGVFVKK
jgi:drug/metabolite transporter (DMT)-like permease